jgi:NAD-dependent histone deacetylase SIR2
MDLFGKAATKAPTRNPKAQPKKTKAASKSKAKKEPNKEDRPMNSVLKITKGVSQIYLHGQESRDAEKIVAKSG